jgi:CHAT domain-containing protein
MQLNQIIGVGRDGGRELAGHPLVVLSACDLGGFLSMGMPTEQSGFPGGFMAISARAIVGSLWPVPDSRPTKRLMLDFHRRLVGSPSNAALSATIAEARRDRIPAVIWAP